MKILLLIAAFFAATFSQAQTIKTPLWSAATNGDTGWNSPIIGPDGTIYQGDVNGNISAFNPDGSTKWSYQIGSDLSGGSSALTRDGSKLYVPDASSPGKIFCVNTSDGSVVWSYTIPAPTHLQATPEPGQQLGGGTASTPAISYDENTIYFGTGNWLECNDCVDDIYDDRFIALDVSGATPTMKWALKETQVQAIQNESRVSFWAAASIATDGTIYTSNFNGFMYHLRDDGTSYTILQQFDFKANQLLPNTPSTSETAEDAPEIWSAAAIDYDGTVYVQSADGYGWALNADLSIKWNFPFLHKDSLWDNFLAPAITPNGLVIMAAENGYIYGINKETGVEAWHYPNDPLPTQEWWRFVSVNADGICILGSEKSGKYYAIDSNTGAYAWETSTIGLETGSCPAIAPDGTIYMTGGADGDLFAFEGTAGLANTAWPKGLQNNAGTSRRDSSGINQVIVTEKIQMSIYPNPTVDEVQVTVEQATDYELINLLGRTVLKGRFDQGHNALSVAGLATGTYWLNIEGTAERLVVKR